MNPEQEKFVLKSLHSLREINVPMVEFEYLYDPAGKNSGQTDPNALSAGGFPTLLFGILQYLYQSASPPIGFSGSDQYKKLWNTVDENLRKNFSVSSEEKKATLECICSTFGKAFLFEVSDSLIALLDERLSLVKQELSQQIVSPPLLKSDAVLLRKIFENEFGLGFLDHRLWIEHRMSLVRKFFTLFKEGSNIGPYPADFLQQANNYLQVYLDVMGLRGAVRQESPSEMSAYAEFWESDLGYFLKYLLEEEFPFVTVNVWIDLYSNTNLFSLKPFFSLTHLLGKRKKEKVNNLVRDGQSQHSGELSIFSLAEKTYPKIGYDPRQRKTSLSFGSGIDMEFPLTLNAEDSLTRVYSQYGGLFDHYPKERINLSEKLDRLMYLSTLLYAKAAPFKTYEIMESQELGRIARPATIIFREKSLNSRQLREKLGSELVVLKEGATYSCGGKKVQLKKLNESEVVESPWQVTVAQAFVSSHVFQKNGFPMHTHVRKLSILDSQGKPIHVGFRFNLATSNNMNSSAFRAIHLFFDEWGKFVVGQVPQENRLFFSLEEEQIELNIGKRDFQRLIEDVGKNWLLGMYYLNKYFETDVWGAASVLVNEGWVDKRYDLVNS